MDLNHADQATISGRRQILISFLQVSSFSTTEKCMCPSLKQYTVCVFILVENLCISEASLHFRRPAPTWSMRKRVTYRASPKYRLISIFHKKNAYFITPHSQPISRNAICSLLSLDPCAERVSFFGSRVGNVQC